MADHHTVKDGKVRAIIRSKYTYGELVRGRAFVNIRPTNYLAWTALRGNGIVAKTIEINGKGAVEFHIADDLHIDIDEYKRTTSYLLTAIVVDDLTGELNKSHFNIFHTQISILIGIVINNLETIYSC